MDQKEKFLCPHCGRKLPFRFILKIKNGHVFECPFCGGAMVPEKTMSSLWGYTIGFIAISIPGQLILYLYDNILFAFMTGFAVGGTALFGIAFYIYSNTLLIKDPSTT